MTMTGGCHCGAVRYVATGAPRHHALCHCSDCRRCAGAPMVGWALFDEGAVTITGAPITYRSSDDGERAFCGTCGTGLFYRNAAIFPGAIDVQSATFDDPSALTPATRIQMAEAPAWIAQVSDMPAFDRFPG